MEINASSPDRTMAIDLTTAHFPHEKIKQRSEVTWDDYQIPQSVHGRYSINVTYIPLRP